MGSISRRAGLSAVLVSGAVLSAQCLWQGPADAAVNVPCSTIALISAINTANGAGSPQTLNLATSCTYTLTGAVASGTRGADGLPIITGNITINGNRSIIRRASPNLFRIFEVAGTLTLRHLYIFGGNAGANTGGAILSAHGTVSLVASGVIHNIADNGAGISNDRGRLTLTDTWVRANTTIPSHGGGGAGIYNDGLLSALRSSIDNNEANTSGGGIYNELGGTMTLTDSYVSGNRAFLRGGGIYNGTGGVAHIYRGQIKYNKAGLYGGGIYNAAGRPAVMLHNAYIHVNEPSNCAPSGTVAGCIG